MNGAFLAVGKPKIVTFNWTEIDPETARLHVVGAPLSIVNITSDYLTLETVNTSNLAHPGILEHTQKLERTFKLFTLRVTNEFGTATKELKNPFRPPAVGKFTCCLSNY